MNLMTVFLQAPAAAPGGGSMMWMIRILYLQQLQMLTAIRLLNKFE